MDILLIEEKTSSLSLIHKLKDNKAKVNVEVVISLKESVEKLGSKKFDVIIVDLNINHSQGINNISNLLQGTKELPIILCAENEEQMRKLKTLDLGIQDIICKRLVRSENILDRIRFVVETYNKSKTDGFMFQRNLF
ncbi:MAG: response regulator [Candidatus Caenarcaniphilales bacterium]|jgi:DNA-binding response OmpR family regulator|nr:response regulator [Candidatus Caenarcaniphilales bacterium]